MCPNPKNMSSSEAQPLPQETPSAIEYSIGRTSVTQNLANIAVEASEKSRKINRAASLAELGLSKVGLHGRDDEVKLLRRKLRDLATNQTSANDIILVAGKSGTGKSALIDKGLGKPALEFGYTFAKGKFDQNLRRPLSAFSDAMANLCRYIQKSNCAALIDEEIQNEFDGERREQLHRVLPGCAEFFGLSSVAQVERDDMSCSTKVSDDIVQRRHSDTVIGVEAVARTQYAVRRLLKIICSHLKGVVLFIDDLQWSDTATLKLLSSIVLDREIPSLLMVGAYREDEVNE